MTGPARRTAEATPLAAGVALISLAWFPPSPLAGAQLSDAIAALGIALVVANRLSGGLRAFWPAPAGVLAALAYALAACGSALATDGNRLRLVGVVWLVVLALGVAIAATARSDAERLRRALVVAAVIGALTGLAGALLYALGYETALLNHAGDLVPGNYPRIRGTMLRANALAGLLALGLVLLADVPQRLRAATGGLLALALVFTFSRSWIALAGSLAFWWLALGSRRSRRRDVAAVACVVVAAAAMLAVSWLNVRLDPTRPWALEIAAEPGTRWIHVTDALATVAAHPLTGVGLGGSAALGWDAHFMLINVAAIMGIPAALALCATLAFALSRAIGVARAGDVAARSIAAVLVLFCLDSLARDIEDQRALWIVVGLALNLSRRSGHPAAEPGPAPAP